MSDFSWPVRVYYEDTDSGGVVYYANYLKFMERARTEWLRAHGFEQRVLVREHGVIFVVRDVHISYLRPAVFDDLLQVTVNIHATGRSWIEFAQTVERSPHPCPLPAPAGSAPAESGSQPSLQLSPRGREGNCSLSRERERVRERAAARSGETGEGDEESLRELDKAEILSRAQVKIVCVNQLSFKPVEIPDIIREKMENRT